MKPLIAFHFVPPRHPLKLEHPNPSQPPPPQPPHLVNEAELIPVPILR
eukprot:gene25811-biopygen8889